MVAKIQFIAISSHGLPAKHQLHIISEL